MHGTVVGSYVPSEPTGATDRARGVGGRERGQPAGAGDHVGRRGAECRRQLNADLIAEDTRLAVAAARQENAPCRRARLRGAPLPLASDALWSGRPNPPLVAEAADLDARIGPGRGLRRGCRRDLARRAGLAGHGRGPRPHRARARRRSTRPRRATASRRGSSWSAGGRDRRAPQEKAYDLVSVALPAPAREAAAGAVRPAGRGGRAGRDAAPGRARHQRPAARGAPAARARQVLHGRRRSPSRSTRPLGRSLVAEARPRPAARRTRGDDIDRPRRRPVAGLARPVVVWSCRRCRRVDLAVDTATTRHVPQRWAR